MRPHYQWARLNTGNIGGAFTLANTDLLAPWRTANGWTLNLPDIVIWRIHLKISIHFTLSPATIVSTNGMFIGIFVDAADIAGGLAVASASPYDQQYMMWDKIYLADVLASNATNFSTGAITLYKEYDIRSHRKMTNQRESLWLQLQPQGDLTVGAGDGYELTGSILLKLPGRG